MKITTIGRGNIGGGLAGLWKKAGHEVTSLGHEGGDASGADVVLVAVPGDAIEAALAVDHESRELARNLLPEIAAKAS